MNIALRIKESQPSVYKALKQRYGVSFNRNKRRKRNDKLIDNDIKELMGQNKARYKRSKGGSMKQI